MTYTGASELVVTCLGIPDLEELSNTTLDVATHSPRYLPVPALDLLKQAAAEATTTFEGVDQEEGWILAEHPIQDFVCGLDAYGPLKQLLELCQGIS